MDRKPNPPVNLLSERALQNLSEGKPVKMVYRDKLAERLGIAPKERLTMTLMDDGHRLMGISVLLDGGDLSPAQEKIFKEFLRESGVFEDSQILGIFPEKPVTS